MKWSKRLESLAEKGEFSPRASSVSGCSPRREVGCLLALAGWYKLPTRLPFLGLPSVITRHLETAEQSSSFALCVACHSFTQAYRRVSEVQQETRFWGTKTQSSKHPYLVLKNPRLALKMKGYCWAVENAGILGLGRRGIQFGASDESFRVTKYKRDKDSDIDLRRGQKECPLRVFSQMI